MAVLTKRHTQHLLAISLTVTAMHGLAAQSPQQATLTYEQNWEKIYADYNTNQFTLELPLTSSNLKTLKSHWKRYSYFLLYIKADNLSGDNLPTLRIGFFPSYEKAKAFKQASEYLYQKQTIKSITPTEHQQVLNSLTAATEPSYFVFAIDGTNKGFNQTQKSLLERAKTLYKDKKYQAAAEHYQLLASLADATTAAWAAELAGLCYEKLGQKSLAIAQYKELLESYPEASGVKRVTQRLRSLETASQQDPIALKSRQQKSDSALQTRGVFGQYYRYADRTINNDSSEDVLSLLSSNWDIRSSVRLQDHDIKLRTSGYWLNDQLDDGENELAIKRFLVDYKHEPTGIGAVLGRQRDSDTGIFTSFDGLTVSYSLRKDIKLAVSGGTPVYTSSVYDDLDYSFYSAQAEWTINKQWQLSSYIINQTVNNVTDREAIGLRGRFYSERLTSSLLIDYDSAFSELNNVLFTLGYKVNDAIQTNFTYGSQRSPFLTASNILIGQADLDLTTYLQSKENKDNLLDNALARTSLNDYYSINVTTTLGDKARWLVDYYDSTLSDIPSSELLLGLPETGTSNNADSFQYRSLGTQLILQDVMHSNDALSLGVRTNQSDSSNSQQLYVTERLRFKNGLTLLPKLVYSQVTFTGNDNSQTQLRYSIELTYRPWRRVEFTLEAGNQAISNTSDDSEFNSSYLFAGYRWSF